MEDTLKWSSNAPKKAGFYWFFGDVSYGSMGCHFRGAESDPPDMEMHLVEVSKISNGLMAVTDGRFMATTKFDPDFRECGYVGVWAVADLPKEPEVKQRYYN